MLGPIFQRELQRAAGHGGQRRWRWVWAGCLVAVFGIGYLYAIGPDDSPSDWGPVQFSEGAHRFFMVLAVLHVLLPVLVLPALTASALAEEKTRGTLVVLLTTELSAWDIVGGRWLAHAVRLADLNLLAWPLLCLLGLLAGFDGAPLFALDSLAPLPALAGAGVLAAVCCRKSTTAVPAAYLLVAGQFAILWLASWRWAALSPFWPLELAVERTDWKPAVEGAAGAWVGWTAVALVCLGLAVWRLRPAYARQLADGGSRPRFRTGLRPPVSDQPVCWKEQHCEGALPLPVLRRLLPEFLVAAVVCLTLLTSLGILACGMGSPWLFFDPMRAVLFFGQGFCALALAGVFVGARAAMTISAERERHTWEPLLAAPLTAEELVREKFAGILAAVPPVYFLAFLGPAFFLSLPSGPLAALATGFWAIPAWWVFRLLAAAGIASSVHSRSSWRGLLSTIVDSGASLFLVGLSTVGLGLLLAGLVYPLLGFAMMGWGAEGVLLLLVLVCGLVPIGVPLIVFIRVLRWLADDSLQQAARELEARDRISQRGTPPSPPKE
jgi:ABC-type transport system involved in multi-copper enzyme maturation permease subunit